VPLSCWPDEQPLAGEQPAPAGEQTAPAAPIAMTTPAPTGPFVANPNPIAGFLARPGLLDRHRQRSRIMAE